MSRRALTITATSLALAWSTRAGATSAPTVYDNAQNYPLGSRSAGMGGAYTALACDEAALHYNPAALACAANSRVEIAANAYMLQHFDAPDSLGPGQHVTATSYHPLPSIAGFVRILSEGDPATGAGRIGAGLSVSVPRSIFLAVDPPNPEKRDFFAITVRDDVLAGDLGAGWQVTPSLALGLSVGGVMRTFQSHAGLLLVRPTPSPCGFGGECYDFVESTEDTELFSIGARAKLGARWQALPQLSFGLTLTSPTIDVYGSAKVSSATAIGLTGVDDMGQTANAHGAVPVRVRGSSAVALPARVALGAALTLPWMILSVDLSASLPREVAVAKDLEEVEIEGIEPSGEEIPDSVITLELQPNVNVGVEIPINDNIVIDLGFFTDLSATSDRDLANDEADRIHMFGGTFAIGLLGRQARSWFGLSFEGGSGTTRVRSEELNFDQILAGDETTQESSYTRWNLVGIIGSSYSFIDDSELPPE